MLVPIRDARFDPGQSLLNIIQPRGSPCIGTGPRVLRIATSDYMLPNTPYSSAILGDRCKVSCRRGPIRYFNRR